MSDLHPSLRKLILVSSGGLHEQDRNNFLTEADRLCAIAKNLPTVRHKFLIALLRDESGPIQFERNSQRLKGFAQLALCHEKHLDGRGNTMEQWHAAEGQAELPADAPEITLELLKLVPEHELPNQYSKCASLLLEIIRQS